MKSQLRSFLPFGVAVSLAAALGGAFTQMSLDSWYPTLQKPSWTPPSYVFGPVWTLLYALMAYSAWRVYRKVGSFANARVPLTLWGIQLVLNALWSGCFFALKSPLLGLIEIFCLMAFVLATTWLFWKQDRLSGLLMLPYCAWGTFATTLAAALWHYN